MSGARTESMKANGKTTKCTALERQNGPMAASTKANTLMTRSTEWEPSIGPTVAGTTVPGRTASSTAEASTS